MIATQRWRRKSSITVRLATAVRLTGLNRSRIYELIQAGDIEIVKVGRAMLVRYDSLQQLSVE